MKLKIGKSVGGTSYFVSWQQSSYTHHDASHLGEKLFQRQILQCRESRSCMLKSQSSGGSCGNMSRDIWDASACREGLEKHMAPTVWSHLPSLNCCLNQVWFTRSNYLNPKRSKCVSKQSKPHTMQTVQKFSKQHPSWLWNVMLFKPCFSWKRCKHRKPCPVSRSTHAGAFVGGGDGVPFAEPKKTFAGQQGLHSSVAGRFGSGWNLPSFTLPGLCCSRAWNWVHPTGLGWYAEEMSVAGCQSSMII